MSWTLLFNGSAELDCARDKIMYADLVGYTFSQASPPGHDSFRLVHVVKNREGPEGVNWTLEEWERAAGRAERRRATEAELKFAVERELSASRKDVDGHIWGPQQRDGFVFGKLTADDRREGGPLAWTVRSLIAMYYIEHDNQPATADEITDWISRQAPEMVQTAIGVAIVTGIP